MENYVQQGKGLDLHNVDNMISVIMPCYNAQSFVGRQLNLL